LVNESEASEIWPRAVSCAGAEVEGGFESSTGHELRRMRKERIIAHSAVGEVARRTRGLVRGTCDKTTLERRGGEEWRTPGCQAACRFVGDGAACILNGRSDAGYR